MNTDITKQMEMVLYRTEDDNVTVSALIKDETIWITQKAMDDERLKQGKTAFGKDYFRELLERVRSIRASERRIWQQITDIFAECSIDYDRDSDTAYLFYATIQNKFHHAITGKTAAEIVYNQADHTKDNMGLTTWKNAPDEQIEIFEYCKKR